MGNDIGQWILIGIGVAFIAFDKARKWFGSSNGKNGKKGNTTQFKYNPHPPGESQICRENRDNIVQLKTKVEGLEEDIREIKTKIKL
jgi:hypothetical protein